MVKKSFIAKIARYKFKLILKRYLTFFKHFLSGTGLHIP